MNYENTHLINHYLFSKKYTNKINDNYEFKHYNLKNNETLTKWANNDIRENVNSIKNLELINENIIIINHENNVKNNIDNTNNTDDTYDTDNTDNTDNINNTDNIDNTNDTYNTDNTDDTDNTNNTNNIDNNIKNNKKNIIKANMKYFNNLHINKWKYHKSKEMVNSIYKIEFEIKEYKHTV